MDIYILHKGQESGPYSEKAVAQLLDQGSIAPSDFAWREGWPDWRPLSEFLTVETASATDLPKPPLEEEMPPREEERSPRGKERPPRGEEMSSRGEEAPAPAKEKVIKGARDSKEPRKEDEGTTLAEPVKSADPAEPASAKQKALLTFLRIAIPAELTKDQAARIINDVMEDAEHARRLSQWNEERFRLHPELFAAEIQAKKENRANHFFELCETDGAEYFNGISKAHCQVLVSFLDVKFPQWDAGPEAAEHYFFPAVAEKFPQLVHKQWKGRLKYNEGGKVASEIVQKSSTSKIRQTRTSPAAAMVKGVAIGLVILGALYLGHRALRQETIAASTSEQASSAGQNSEPGAVIVPAPPAPGPTTQTPPGTAGVSSAPPNAAAPVETPVSTTAAATSAPASDPSSGTAPAVAAASPVSSPSSPMGDANMGAPMTSPVSGEPVAPVAPPAPTLPVAGSLPTAPPTPAAGSEMAVPVLGPDPNATTASGAAATAAGPVAPSASSLPVVGQAPASVTATAKINLLLTKPVEIQLAYGKIMLPPGTPVKLMSRQGYLLKVAYQSSVITVPVGSTDFE